MKLKKTDDNSFLGAEIKKLLSSEFELLTNSNRFRFDWTLERHSDVYKIFLISESDNILGLMSISDDENLRLIDIELIESSLENQGKSKEYEFIAGCLIAFAVSLSYERGYLGVVTLSPKNQLIDHYRLQYGFEEIGYQMMTSGENSMRLIKKYLTNE